VLLNLYNTQLCSYLATRSMYKNKYYLYSLLWS